MKLTDEIVLHSNSTLCTQIEDSEVRRVFAGVGLFMNKMYHVVDRWKLFGFCKRDSVLIGGGWFGFLDPSCLVITPESACRMKSRANSGFSDDEYKPYYAIIEKSESNIPVLDPEKYKKIDVF